MTTNQYEHLSDDVVLRRCEQKSHAGDPSKATPVIPIAAELARRYRSLQNVMECGHAFHELAVAQRNGAWHEVDVLKEKLERAQVDRALLDVMIQRADQHWTNAMALAEGVITIAQQAGVPDSFWDTDERLVLAAHVLGIPADEAREWDGDASG